MASSSSKQLWEHLQEQQKPFILDAYLSERRVMLNKDPKRTCSYELNKKEYLHITRILKMILRKLTVSSHSQQVSSSDKVHNHELTSKTMKKPQQIGGAKWFSEVSNSVSVVASSKCSVKYLPLYENYASLLERTSQGLQHRNFKEQEAVADTNAKCGCREDNKQLSPVSVLNNEVPLSNKVYHFQSKHEDGASPSGTILSKDTEEGSLLSAFLWELLIKSLTEKQSDAGFAKLQEIIGPDASRHLKNKRVLQQSEQLLFDCVNEAIEMHERKNRRKKYVQEFMDLHELERIISDQICSWRKQNEAQQKNYDVTGTIEDWDYLQQINGMIAIEIGDTIINEIIQEVIDVFLQ